MKKTIILIIITLSTIILTSCWKQNEQQVQQNLNDKQVVENLKHINNAMDKAMNWWNEKDIMQELNQLKEVKQSNNLKKLPKWLYDLWFIEPNWLKADNNYSEITEKSVTLHYKANNYEQAIKEAEKIAKSMWLKEPISSPRKQVESMLSMIPDPAQQEEMKKNMKWAVFTNCNWWNCTWDKYTKMISVGWSDQSWWVIQVTVIENK